MFETSSCHFYITDSEKYTKFNSLGIYGMAHGKHIILISY